MANQSPRSHRRHSAETLQLDLNGLDLGGNEASPTPFDNAADHRHARSRSNTGALQQPFTAFTQPFPNPTYPAVDFNMDPFGPSCPPQEIIHEPLNTLEDSFSLHLQAECSDYRQIMPSQVVLNAAVDKEQRLRNAVLDPVVAQRERGFSISHGQVLGGFASLGMQTEPDVQPSAPRRQQPLRTITKGSTDSSEAPATPAEWRDSFGTLCEPPYAQPPPKWAHLTPRPCNPLEPLDVLSIQEMGFHSLDMGSLSDWEGCKLSAEILCPINGHQRIEWSVAQTTRKNKKWVVVPNATVTCGHSESLSAAAQAERTVIVSARPLALDGPEAAGSRGQGQSQPSHRNALPFSGKAGYELRLLRPVTGRICSPVYLANPSTHRSAHRDNVLQPTHSPLRRTRSRPYLRQPHAPLRRSRSKPYLRHSAAQQAAAEAAAARTNPEEFAPSLPGDPLVHMLPGESWPSARSRQSDSLSSMDSPSSSDLDSNDSSDDEAGFSANDARGSVIGSMSSASYDQSIQRNVDGTDGGRTKSVTIPVRHRALSPGSSASRNISSSSDVSAGPMSSSLEHQRNLTEGESWHGTSPTTASASSISASSKQSRSRKGLQRALQKKDKMLNSWFKRRPEGTAATSSSQASERAISHGGVPSSLPGPTQSVPTKINSRSRSSTIERDASEMPAAFGPNGSTPLTEMALENFQRAVFRPASPESTIMGSRRGSEALTQKNVDPSAAMAKEKTAANIDDVPTYPTRGRASEEHTGGADNRSAVNSTLAQVYGWNQQQTAAKLLRSDAPSTAGSSVRDLDEECALLGIDAVPAAALTMLIPLPLIGRNRAQEAVRYMRVNFVPFGNVADSFESTLGMAPAGLPNAASSPSNEGDAVLSHSISASSSGLGSNRETSASGSSTAKSSEQSSWKRKLGLASGLSRSGGSSQPVTPLPDSPASLPTSASVVPQAFRVTAIVYDAPWTPPNSTAVDPRLPEAGTFPVVLGYCNGSKGLEMVPEGWGALKLAGVPIPTKPDGSPLDGVHPLHGVTDLIIAACSAVMDV